MKKRYGFIFTILIILILAETGRAYKIRAWEPGPRESYPARQTSEGVTIAVEPLYTNELAARVFDKKDMVTRGIMPVAVVIFNDNDFPVEVSGRSIELIHRDQPDIHIRTMPPNEVTWRLERRDKTWRAQRIPDLRQERLDRKMLEDFDKKFLLEKTVEARSQGGGFLYLHLPENEPEKIAEFLAGALLYIPRIYRLDDGTRLIYFEVALARIFHQGS